jgi:hypothetical protein
MVHGDTIQQPPADNTPEDVPEESTEVTTEEATEPVASLAMEGEDVEGEHFKLGTAPAPETETVEDEDPDDYEVEEFTWTEPRAVGDDIKHTESGNIWTDFSMPGRQAYLRTLSAPKLRGLIEKHQESIDYDTACVAALSGALDFAVKKGNV